MHISFELTLFVETSSRTSSMEVVLHGIRTHTHTRTHQRLVIITKIGCRISSIEHNLHPTMSPAVPTILIDGDTFRVILYDCIKDVLLITTPKELHTDGRLSSTAVAFLWLVINHRQFLQPIPAVCTKYPAKVKEVLQDSLEDFCALRSKNLNWHSESEPYFVEGSDLPISGNKRIKLSTNN